MSNPLIVPENKSVSVELTRLIQREGQFVALVLGAYHGRFNCGYNIAKATTSIDFSWPGVGRLVSKKKERERPFMRCTIPAYTVLWQEATSLVFLQSKNKPCPYKIPVSRSLSIALKNAISKSENIINHFLFNDHENVLILDGHINRDQLVF